MSSKLGTWKFGHTPEEGEFEYKFFPNSRLKNFHTLYYNFYDINGINHKKVFENFIIGDTISVLFPNIYAGFNKVKTVKAFFQISSIDFTYGNENQVSFGISIVSAEGGDGEDFTKGTFNVLFPLYAPTRNTGTNTVEFVDNNISTDWETTEKEPVASTAEVTMTETFDPSWNVSKEKSSQAATAKVTMTETFDSSWNL